MMNVNEFVDKLKMAEQCRTLYVMGCFGWPMTKNNKTRCINEEKYNAKRERKYMIENTDDSVFGFDCVNLIKGILWGWNANYNHTYGGAVYKSNEVPDSGADNFFSLCKIKRTDFSKIVYGAAVWMEGHIGVYVGNGQVIECSPRWQNGVQYTNLANIGKTSGHARTWTAWGLIPFVDYTIDEKKNEEVKNVYNTIDECPDFSKEAVKYFVDNDLLKGIDEKGTLALRYEEIRYLVILYRTLKQRGVI